MYLSISVFAFRLEPSYTALHAGVDVCVMKVR